MGDTERREAPRFGAACAALAIVIGLSSSCAASNGHRILWTRADHVYVALDYGAAVAEGDSARFEERGKALAAGRVAEVVRGELAIVSLPPGALGRVKKIERVHVTFMRAGAARPPSLRVALPAGGRGNLAVPCAAGSDGLPVLPRDLRGYVLNERERSERPLRLRPDPHAVPPPGWPDTLIVSFFASATDEEIALERGDVDVAVFWPGELSRRMRDDARWKDTPHGLRSRGVVAITGADLVPAGLDSATVRALDDELFRGDLEWTGAFVSASERGPGRLGIDESLPGFAAIREWLARRLGTPRGGIVGRIAYVDAPFDSAPAPGFQPLYRMTCPVVSGPAWRPVIERMGPGVFADMIPCTAAIPPR
ncbi:MAG TPA: hypothetical protein VL503_07005 [Candidatus Omnitrophota bacterium]|jgi:hypothetical protein|nr:hypothetical protein [Candidatus Omnitrophota bacterium]